MSQTRSGSCGLEKGLLTLTVFERRTVHSVATHYTACTPHLKYLSTAKYRDDVTLLSLVGYSLSVGLSVGAADCYYRDSSFLFRWDKRMQFFLLRFKGVWNIAIQIHNG